MAYLSDKKPPELTALTTLADDDNVIVGDTSDASEDAKSITWANTKAMLGLLYASISHTHTKSEVTDLNAYEVGGTDVAITDGGTGASTAAGARAALGAQAVLLEGAFVDGDKTKVSNISITQPVDLDAIESRVNGLDQSIILKGTWDASVGTFPGGGTAQAGESWIVSVGGTVGGVTFTANDRMIAILDNASTTVYALNWHKADYTDEVQSVYGRTGAVTGQNGDYTTAQVTVSTDKNYVTDAEKTVIGNTSGTNTGDITLAGTPNYITIVGQVITRALINLTSHVTGILPVANGGTGASTASGARTALGVAIGTDVQAYDANNTTSTNTQTVTNKRITKREQTVASAATVTPVWTNDDIVTITAQAVGLTLANPTGTGTDGQAMVIRIKDNATSRTIVYGTQYRAIGVTLPTATTASKTIYLGGFWNVADSKLDVTAVAEEA